MGCCNKIFVEFFWKIFVKNLLKIYFLNLNKIKLTKFGENSHLDICNKLTYSNLHICLYMTRCKINHHMRWHVLKKFARYSIFLKLGVCIVYILYKWWGLYPVCLKPLFRSFKARRRPIFVQNSPKWRENIVPKKMWGALRELFHPFKMANISFYHTGLFYLLPV